MIWTALALAAMIGLGGFIAYYGDLTGRRWGKSKRSMMGLRPRHTAILVTSMTGSFIALFSVATLLTINKPLRDLVLRGETEAKENQKTIAQQHRTLDAQHEQLREAGANNQTMVAQLALTHDSLESKQTQLAVLNKRELELRCTITTLQQQLRVVRDSVAQVQFRYVKLNAQYRVALSDNTKVVAQNTELSKQNVTFSRENLELAKTQKDLTKQVAKLTSTQTELNTVNGDLTRVNTVLKESSQKINDECNSLAQELDDKRAQLADVQGKLASLTNDFNFVSDQRINFAHAFLDLRQGKFSLRVGAELARRTIPSHLRPEAVQRELKELLDDANATALAHKAALGDNGRAIYIVRKHVVTLAEERDEDESASLAAVTDKIVGADTPVVVIASAVNNSVEGEPIMIDLGLYEVHKAFDKGQQVAVTTIDASQPTRNIFDQLVGFLNKDVREAALKAHTVPQTDPETGEKRMGSIDNLDLLNVAERARRMGSDVIVTAMSADTTTTADPIRLNFRLKRAPSKP